MLLISLARSSPPFSSPFLGLFQCLLSPLIFLLFECCTVLIPFLPISACLFPSSTIYFCSWPPPFFFCLFPTFFLFCPACPSLQPITSGGLGSFRACTRTAVGQAKQIIIEQFLSSFLANFCFPWAEEGTSDTYAGEVLCNKRWRDDTVIPKVQSVQAFLSCLPQL